VPPLPCTTTVHTRSSPHPRAPSRASSPHRRPLAPSPQPLPRAAPQRLSHALALTPPASDPMALDARSPCRCLPPPPPPAPRRGCRPGGSSRSSPSRAVSVFIDAVRVVRGSRFGSRSRSGPRIPPPSFSKTPTISPKLVKPQLVMLVMLVMIPAIGVWTHMRAPVVRRPKLSPAFQASPAGLRAGCRPQKRVSFVAIACGVQAQFPPIDVHYAAFERPERVGECSRGYLGLA
jgi:hypothetical protein